jgi:glutamine synthetase adenylyltransferase
MKFLKYTLTFILGLFFMAGTAYAQGQQMQRPPAQADSISDEELEQFAEVATEVQNIQQDSKETVDSLLSENDMEMERFQQIMMSQQNPQDSVNITEEEQQTIEELQPALMQMQQESQQRLINSIEENGLNPQRYQQIMQALRSNPEVMQRFQEVAGESKQQ